MSVITSGDTVASLSVVSFLSFQSGMKHLLQIWDFKVVQGLTSALRDGFYFFSFVAMATSGFSILLKLNFSGYSIIQYTYSGLAKSSTLKKSPHFFAMLYSLHAFLFSQLQ